ncbi:MAG: hypothetical protein AAF514_08345 [Verrucomicrobiota bacterium]
MSCQNAERDVQPPHGHTGELPQRDGIIGAETVDVLAQIGQAGRRSF